MSTPDPPYAWTEAMQDLALMFIDLVQVNTHSINPGPVQDHLEELYDDLHKLQIILADEGTDMTEEINLVLDRIGHKTLEPI